MDPILRIHNLKKDFEGHAVLHGIDLTVQAGEFLCIMGQSGSGKSTLLHCASGMDRPTEGSVRLCGGEIAALRDEALADIRLRRMGFIFQHAHLLKNLTILDNIVLPGIRHGAHPRDTVTRKAKELLGRTGIAAIAHHDIRNVSGGQLQRAAICRALINDPEIVFGDEPTGALNSGATEEVMNILNEINQDGTAIVLVTHSARVAARADRVVFLKDGRIQSQLQLGKAPVGQTPAYDRERTLSSWLEAQGF